MNYLSVCAIAKDETAYLREWVNYHTLVGVERFFLYDNGSRVSVRETLAPEVASGRVVVVDVPWPRPQMVAYAHCLRSWGTQSRWMAFIDLDEFIVPRQAADLQAFLKAYEPYGGVGVYWKIFGSSGHLEKPAGLQVGSFLQATPDGYEPNRLFKSIVQPQYACFPLVAHTFVFRPGHGLVNEDGQPILGAGNPPRAARTVQLNHYYTRSAAEFREKIARGNPIVAVGARTMDEFMAHDRAAVVDDRAILEVLGRKLPAAGEADLARAAAACPVPEALPEAALPLDAANCSTFEASLLADLLQAAEAQADWVFVEQLLRVALWRFCRAAWLWQAAWFWEPYLKLCDVFTAGGQFAGAMELLEAAIEGRPAAPEAWTRLGLNRYGQRDWPGTEAAFRKALGLAPQCLDALLSLSRLCLDQRRYPEARYYLRRAVSARPDEVEGWVGLALAEQALEDWPAFQEAYHRAAALDPRHPRLAQLHPSLLAGSQPAEG